MEEVSQGKAIQIFELPDVLCPEESLKQLRTHFLDQDEYFGFSQFDPGRREDLPRSILIGHRHHLSLWDWMSDAEGYVMG